MSIGPSTGGSSGAYPDYIVEKFPDSSRSYRVYKKDNPSKGFTYHLPVNATLDEKTKQAWIENCIKMGDEGETISRPPSAIKKPDVDAPPQLQKGRSLKEIRHSSKTTSKVPSPPLSRAPSFTSGSPPTLSTSRPQSAEVKNLESSPPILSSSKSSPATPPPLQSSPKSSSSSGYPTPPPLDPAKRNLSTEISERRASFASKKPPSSLQKIPPPLTKSGSDAQGSAPLNPAAKNLPKSPPEKRHSVSSHPESTAYESLLPRGIGGGLGGGRSFKTSPSSSGSNTPSSPILSSNKSMDTKHDVKETPHGISASPKGGLAARRKLKLAQEEPKSSAPPLHRSESMTSLPPSTSGNKSSDIKSDTAEPKIPKVPDAPTHRKRGSSGARRATLPPNMRHSINPSAPLFEKSDDDVPPKK